MSLDLCAASDITGTASVIDGNTIEITANGFDYTELTRPRAASCANETERHIAADKFPPLRSLTRSAEDLFFVPQMAVIAIRELSLSAPRPGLILTTGWSAWTTRSHFEDIPKPMPAPRMKRGGSGGECGQAASLSRGGGGVEIAYRAIFGAFPT